MKQVINDLIVLSLQAQIVHWKTGNYAAHIATEELYDGLRGFTDSLVEALRGTEELEEILPDTIGVGFDLDVNTIIENMDYHLVHFEGLKDLEFGVQNIIDDICTLIRTQIYKLTYLS